jgi:hypothetical protein
MRLENILKYALGFSRIEKLNQIIKSRKLTRFFENFSATSVKPRIWNARVRALQIAFTVVAGSYT